jgi:hypothetical protein
MDAINLPGEDLDRYSLHSMAKSLRIATSSVIELTALLYGSADHLPGRGRGAQARRLGLSPLPCTSILT